MSGDGADILRVSDASASSQVGAEQQVMPLPPADCGEDQSAPGTLSEFNYVELALGACMVAHDKSHEHRTGQPPKRASVARLAVADVLGVEHKVGVTPAAEMMGLPPSLLFGLRAGRKSRKTADDVTIAEPTQNLHEAIGRALAPYRGRSTELAETVRALLSHLGVDSHEQAEQGRDRVNAVELPQNNLMAAVSTLLTYHGFAVKSYAELREYLGAHGYPDEAAKSGYNTAISDAVRVVYTDPKWRPSIEELTDALYEDEDEDEDESEDPRADVVQGDGDEGDDGGVIIVRPDDGGRWW